MQRRLKGSKVKLSAKAINVQFDWVLIEERFRTEMGDIAGLKDSIEEHGLLERPVVGMLEKGVFGALEKGARLLAGGRRMAALAQLGAEGKLDMDAIPVRLYPYGTFTELERLKVELVENEQRKEMTWVEKNALRAAIYNESVKVHGVKTSPMDKQGTSIRQVAEEMGVSASNLTRAVSLDNTVQAIGKEAAEKFASEEEFKKFTKTVLKDHGVKKKVEAVKKQREEEGVSSIVELALKGYQIGDALEGMRGMKAESVDFVEIDPPYGVELDIKKNQGVMDRGYNEVPQGDYQTFMRTVLCEAYRVMRPDSWAICWFGPKPWAEMIHAEARDAGFRTHYLWGIWAKRDFDGADAGAQTLSPTKALGNAWEPFFILRKGSPDLNKAGSHNLFAYPPVPAVKKVHPTERPAALIRDILELFVQPGSTVLVPFLGSGRTLLEALRYECECTGFDLTPEFKDRFIITANEELGDG